MFQLSPVSSQYCKCTRDKFLDLLPIVKLQSDAEKNLTKRPTAIKHYALIIPPAFQTIPVHSCVLFCLQFELWECSSALEVLDGTRLEKNLMSLSSTNKQKQNLSGLKCYTISVLPDEKTLQH